MAGDFNAKTGSAALNSDIYHEVIGKYGKGEINSKGYSLLNFAKSYKLKLTNTFFKLKQAHRSTWQSHNRINGCIDSNTKTPRNAPYRNQIDYICVRYNKGITINDSRSYGGTNTNSDHKLVMMNIIFKWTFTK